MTRSPSAVTRVSIVPAVILLLPTNGRAQDAESASSGGLQEVTVTATRREETQSKVPISITAFTQEQMDSQGLRQVVRAHASETRHVAVSEEAVLIDFDLPEDYRRISNQ